MVDLILISFAVGMFYGGFRCGAKYVTFKEMARSCVDKVSSWVGK